MNVQSTVQPTVSETERRRRWRLLLGPAVDDVWAEAESGGEGDQGSADPDGDSSPGQQTMPSNRPSDGAGLRGDDRRIDAALGAVYDRGETGSRGKGRAGGLSRSKPSVMRWLGDIRRYFPTPVVQVSSATPSNASICASCCSNQNCCRASSPTSTWSPCSSNSTVISPTRPGPPPAR